MGILWGVVCEPFCHDLWQVVSKYPDTKCQSPPRQSVNDSLLNFKKLKLAYLQRQALISLSLTPDQAALLGHGTIYSETSRFGFLRFFSGRTRLHLMVTGHDLVEAIAEHIVTLFGWNFIE